MSLGYPGEPDQLSSGYMDPLPEALIEYLLDVSCTAFQCYVLRKWDEFKLVSGFTDLSEPAQELLIEVFTLVTLLWLHELGY